MTGRPLVSLQDRYLRPARGVPKPARAIIRGGDNALAIGREGGGPNLELMPAHHVPFAYRVYCLVKRGFRLQNVGSIDISCLVGKRLEGKCKRRSIVTPSKWLAGQADEETGLGSKSPIEQRERLFLG